MSGGEFCDVQNNVRGEPTSTVSADDDNVAFITGAAVKETQMLNHNKLMFYHLKTRR